MKRFVKRIIKRMIAWYIAPMQEQIQSILQSLKALEESVNSNQERTHMLLIESDKRLSDIEEREGWTRGRFEEQDSRLSGIEEREGWTRGRFEEQDSRLSGIEEREGWTRGRFEEQDSRLAGIEEREGWARGRFEEQSSRISDIESREEWTRERFEEQEQKIAELREMIERLSLQGIGSEHGVGQVSFSQSGEDAIITYILQFMRISAESVTYLDLGANHAKELSNTFCFYQQGASGVLVEANPELIPELKRERSRDTILNCIVGPEDGGKNTFYVLNGDGLSTVDLENANAACEKNPELYLTGKHEVDTIGINTILERYFDGPFTILSIDLEGSEEEILRCIDFLRYRPLIIILENIPYTPLLSIGQREFCGVEFLKDYGYIEYAFTGINSIFVDAESVSKFNKQRAEELQNYQWEDSLEIKNYMQDMPYHSLTVEGLTYFYNRRDRLIPECMIKTGINFSKGDIDNFIRFADQLFYQGTELPEGIFLDIGANIGTTTVYCKKKKKPQLQFIAFEPVRENAELLAANCAINGLTEGVVIEQVACSNSDGNIVRMIINESNSRSSHCENCPEKGMADEQLVRTISLDRYMNKQHIDTASVKYIWIDVEGHETEVLEGALKLYSRTIPTCLEFNQDVYRKEGTYPKMIGLLKRYFTKFAVCVQVAAGNEEFRSVEDIEVLWEELEGKPCDLILL